VVDCVFDEVLEVFGEICMVEEFDWVGVVGVDFFFSGDFV